MNPTITLIKPLKFGEDIIAELPLRRPMAGDLRGIKLAAIQELDVTTILSLVQRLSTVPLAPDTLTTMDPVDIVQACEVISGFFVPARTPSPTTH
ncbi:MAG TPA: phage tail assembly protein [Candidatus Sulfotelmatobacter sp.]|jgi:hypothetical protein|nr:phage tail assembly protein [Candidatus Sulfotelmatobacter sp.]